jgi:hypothetical protein
VQADIRNLPHTAGAFDGIWAAASLIHLPKPSVHASLRCLAGLVTPGGILAATFIHGRGAGIVHSDWIPDRFISRWHKDELAAAIGRTGWKVVELKTVSGQERKGRWLNLIARRSHDSAPSRETTTSLRSEELSKAINSQRIKLRTPCRPFAPLSLAQNVVMYVDNQQEAINLRSHQTLRCLWKI